jgi:integrative and conjugative element protein (TIGR02256 family)
MTSWISLHPELYQQERKQIEKNYPRLRVCTSALDEGVLRYHGEILVRGSGGTRRHKVVLTYPDTFPYQLPIVQPVENLPNEEPHPGWKITPVIRNARHQMSSGALCLIEPDPFRQSGEIIRGVDILRRAESWFFSSDTGTNPYDSPEADIQAHLPAAGDVLIGPEFYDPVLRVGGIFYAAFVWGTGTARARYVALAISSDFSLLAIFRDSKQTLARPFPWVKSEVWDAAQAVSQGSTGFNELLDTGAVIRGVWWDLSKEPLPPRMGTDVLDIIRESGHENAVEQTLRELRADISKNPYAFIAFRFPGRVEGFDWLFTAIKLRNKALREYQLLRTTDEKIAVVSAGSVAAVRRHPLLPRALTLRNKGRVPETLGGKKVSILGSGALGASVGDLLTKAGVGSVFVFDRDIMEVGNSIRHVAGVESFALPKAEATALKFIQHNPFVDIQVGLDDLLSSYETLESSLTDCDFAISTMADESAESAVNEVATRMGKMVYYARAVRGGASGRIFRVIPGRDACRYCLARYIREGEAQNELSAWLNVPEDEDTVLAFECGNPIIASSAADLSLIASLAARVVMDDIGAGLGAANHWLWTTEGVADHPALSEPYKLHAKEVPPYPDCPFCSDPPVKTIIMPAQVRAFMSQQAAAANGNEVCGILLGYFREDNTVEVTEASDAGPNARSTLTGCWRDVEYVQQWIDERLQRGGGRLRYVGEWHSHPSLDTRPSHIDVDSLMGIAASQDYLCPTPVMVVLGQSANGEERLSAYSFAVARPYKEIAVEYIGDQKR